MFEIDLRGLTGMADGSERLASIVARAEKISKGSDRDAVNFLTQGIGLIPKLTIDEPYFREAFNYTLALAYAYLDKPALAAEHLKRSGMLPYNGGDILFSEAVDRCLEVSAQQEASLERHVPCTFMASMPRSASAALASTISKLFGCPTARASLGQFPNYYLMPFWMFRLLRGGCVLHDHFGASAFNQQVLLDTTVRTVFVLIRDPRASAASVSRMETPQNQNVSEELVLHWFEKAYIPWLLEWDEFAKNSGNVNVIWLKSSDVTGGKPQLQNVIKQIIEVVSPSAPDWQPPDLSELELADVNFVSGSPDGWRRFVSKLAQEQMWSRIPVKFRDMLELEP